MKLGRNKGVYQGRFTARIMGEVRGVEEQKRKWFSYLADLLIPIGSTMVFGHWTWMAREIISVIDYIMIGGGLTEENILDMRVGD